MSRRLLPDAEALRWLGLTLAIDQAIDNPKALGVADLVTPRSWHALVYVSTRPDAVAAYSEIRDSLGLSQNTMTRVVKALERARYVLRSFDGSTGAVLLRLTPDGRNALGEIYFHASKFNV